MNKSTAKNFSAISIEWLKYTAKAEGIHIQHAMNGGDCN